MYAGLVFDAGVEERILMAKGLWTKGMGSGSVQACVYTCTLLGGSPAFMGQKGWLHAVCMRILIA